METLVLTISHAPLHIFNSGMEAFSRTADFAPRSHFVIDNAYPGVVIPNANLRFKENVGLKRAFNYALDKFVRYYPDDSILVGYDPDSFPLTKGWLQALYLGMLEHPKLSVLSLSHVKMRGRNFVPHEWNNSEPRIGFRGQPDYMNITAWRLGFLRRIGGLPMKGDLYGPVEHPTYEATRKLGVTPPAYLLDFYEGNCPLPPDPEYKEWKELTSSRRVEMSFKEFVNERRRFSEDRPKISSETRGRQALDAGAPYRVGGALEPRAAHGPQEDREDRDSLSTSLAGKE